MLPDLVLLSTLTGSNYPCLELIFMVPKVFEPLKFDCILQHTKYSRTGSKATKAVANRAEIEFRETHLKFDV